MPKLKTHKGAQKRFQVTSNKKAVHKKANKSHILTKKASKRKRNLGRKAAVSRADIRTIRTMLPYDF
jgi:large subunit ribosomal protein L35